MSGARADELIKELFGEPNAEGDRRVEILHAHTAALAWVREATGRYPAPRHIAERLVETADKLKHDAAAGNPHEILMQVAVRTKSTDESDFRVSNSSENQVRTRNNSCQVATIVAYAGHGCLPEISHPHH